jgi:cation diffusion facilitator family transporter
MTKTRASFLGIIGNSVLFILKIIVGIIFNSISLISDAINSLTDIISSIVVHISIKVSQKSADFDHPFGHHRAEPIAGLVVAIFTGIVGFEILKESIIRILSGKVMLLGTLPIVILLITIITKISLFIYVKKVSRNSPALQAQAIDHKNDVIISFSALIGVIGVNIGYFFLDAVMAILIGFWIIRQGYNIANDNIKYLMGEVAPKEITNKVIKKAESIQGVKRINEIRAHYVGTLLQIEIHISVDRDLTTYRSHAIGKKVQLLIQKMHNVNYCFVHIDPIIKSRPH